MNKENIKSYGKWVIYALTVLVAIASWLPISEWNVWWIRMLDFPRLQIGIVCLVLLAIVMALFRKQNAADYVAVLLLVSCLAYHGWKLAPYTSFHSKMLVGTELSSPGPQIKVLSANVQMTSENPDKLVQIVRNAAPDLFLALETNERWDRALSVLTNQMPHQAQHINTNYFGMNLFSRLPLVDPQIRFFSRENVPAILTRVRLPDGSLIRFFGIHPRPPHWNQSSADRDAQLMSAALAAKEDGPPVILAGDLNAVPWERTMWRLLRLGEFLQPRVGRTYWATYKTSSWFESWPLDYVLCQEEFALQDFQVLSAFGSDHYPVMAVLGLPPGVESLQSAPPPAANDMQEARTAISRGRAEEVTKGGKP